MRRLVVFAAEENRAVLHVGAAHARAELDEIFVGVDDGALDHLRRAHVVAALVEGDPAPAKEAVLPGLLKGKAPLWSGYRRREPTTTHALLRRSYTSREAPVKKRSPRHLARVQREYG